MLISFPLILRSLFNYVNNDEKILAKKVKGENQYVLLFLMHKYIRSSYASHYSQGCYYLSVVF